MEYENRIFLGDLFDVLPTLPENTFDSVVTDPPYGIRFMGKAWDGADIVKTAKRQARKSPRPDRNRMWTGENFARAAGTYDLSLTANKAFQEWTEAWAREVLRVLKPSGHLLAFGSPRTYHRLASGVEDAGFEIRDTVAWLFGGGFPKAKSTLKPAFEPVVVARKPGPILPYNIDSCRIPVESEADAVAQRRAVSFDKRYFIGAKGLSLSGSADGSLYKNINRADFDPSRGRWPANVCHDGSPEVLAGFPDNRSPRGSSDREDESWSGYADDGSAARFFYCSKARRGDRNEGLEEETKNVHPTVKPTPLMRWLVRLVTPMGGLVLDPFAGSGSTLKAAVQEGRGFCGIEREEQYWKIAEARVAAAVRAREEEARRGEEGKRQLALF